MRAVYLSIAGALLFAAWGRPPARADGAPDTSDDVRTLTIAGLRTDGPALLEFFRERARLDADADRLVALTQQLGDPAAEVRAHAAAQLVSRGTPAIPVLRHAVNNFIDSVVSDRARRCLQAIEGPTAAAVPAAAARLVEARKLAGAAEVLLAYLPFADNQVVADEVTHALTAVAFASGKPDSALLHALDDPVPIRRAAAAEALCRKDHPEQWPAVRKLLLDPKPTVRLRVAVALARQQDVDSIPVLVDLIGQLPPAPRRQAEEVLEDLAGEWAPQLSLRGDDAITRRIRRDAWAAWWRNTDGPALLAEFRKRTLSVADQNKIQALIRQLGADNFDSREQAVTELVAHGFLVVPFLREALKDKDAERVRRAETCLRLIAQSDETPLPAAAARLLALRKPAGAVEALLAYLGCAEESAMIDAVQAALTDLATHDGKLDPVLVRALEDKLPRRRAAAAEALVQAGGPAQRPAVRKLLVDADGVVRLRVALALATAHDKEAVPVLINALADLPLDAAGQAHDALYVLAGDKAPSQALGPDPAAQRKCRDAWAAWWQAHAGTADLARLDTGQALLGYTLLVELHDNGTGRVVELGRDGKPRWQIDGLQFPVDAHVLRGDRVLVAEYNGMKVTERDLKGNIVWQKQGLGSQPVNAQRLANGNTFIATMNSLLEVDPSGKEVFQHVFPGQNVWAAHKSRSGEITCFLSPGSCVRLDGKGHELKRFNSGRDGGWTSGIDVMPNGHVIAAQPNRNVVVEFDPDGKTVWEAQAPGITSATRLPNGRTLVASHPGRNVIELDRAGKTVWEYKDEYHQFRARRR